MYLIERIKEYQKRYETETYNPELHGLLNKMLEHLEEVEFIHNQITQQIDEYLKFKGHKK